jgi:hypothetical protein
MVFNATFNNIIPGWSLGLWCLTPLSTIEFQVMVYDLAIHYHIDFQLTFISKVKVEYNWKKSKVHAVNANISDKR